MERKEKRIFGPRSEQPKDILVKVRMDRTMLDELDQSAEFLHTTRSEIIRKGIHQIFCSLQEKKD